jgi:uncharacterized protein with FMN-binding domain
VRLTIMAVISTVAGLVLLFSFKTVVPMMMQSQPTAMTTTEITGQPAVTGAGPVQVRLTLANGKITKVAVRKVPGKRAADRKGNQVVLDTLISETLAAQSAHISKVPGQAGLSSGYISSLCSALKKAHAQHATAGT